MAINYAATVFHSAAEILYKIYVIFISPKSSFKTFKNYSVQQTSPQLTFHRNYQCSPEALTCPIGSDVDAVHGADVSIICVVVLPSSGEVYELHVLPGTKLFVPTRAIKVVAL